VRLVCPPGCYGAAPCLPAAMWVTWVVDTLIRNSTALGPIP